MLPFQPATVPLAPWPVLVSLPDTNGYSSNTYLLQVTAEITNALKPLMILHEIRLSFGAFTEFVGQVTGRTSGL